MAKRSPNELSTIHNNTPDQDGGDPTRLAMTSKLRDLARMLETSELEATLDEAQADEFSLITIKIRQLPTEQDQAANTIGSGMPNLGFKNIPDIVQTE